MENEVREVTYLSIGLILVAIVLSFIAQGMSIKNNIAETRNSQLRSNESIEQYREFNAYNATTLIGDEVIELIRQKYDTGISLFVDYRENKSTNEVVDSNETCVYCDDKDGNHRLYNLDNYLSHATAPSDYNYFTLAQNAVGAERNDMRNWYPSVSKYRVYLVYNSYDVEKYYTHLIDNFATEASRYVDTESGKLQALDSGEMNFGLNAEVTGIVLISYKTLGIQEGV